MKLVTKTKKMVREAGKQGEEKNQAGNQLYKYTVYIEKTIRIYRALDFGNTFKASQKPQLLGSVYEGYIPYIFYFKDLSHEFFSFFDRCQGEGNELRDLFGLQAPG